MSDNQPLAINTKRAIVHSLLFALQKLKLPISEANEQIIREYSELLNTESDDLQHHKKETNKLIPLKTYQTRVLRKFGADSKEHLLTTLYSELPLRDNFGKLHIVHKQSDVDDNGDYILIPSKGKGRVFIRHYKTVGKYGPFEEQLSDPLTNLVRSYIKNNRLVEYLFNKNQGPSITAMSKQVITPREQRLMGGESISSTLFRKMVVSSLDWSASAEERTALARTMKHSVRVQRTYHRAPSK